MRRTKAAVKQAIAAGKGESLINSQHNPGTETGCRERFVRRLWPQSGLARRRWCFFLLALAWGGLCSLIAWPGIFYSDSYGRWFVARALSELNFALLDDWLSVPPQLFMGAYYLVTQNYGGYTLLQAVAFFFVCFCAIDAFCPKGGLVAGILFAAAPVFYGFSVYLEMSVGCVTALLALLMLLLKTDHEQISAWPRRKKILYWCAAFFLYFCVLGFRQNALTLLPVLLFAAWRAGRAAKTKLPLLLHGSAIAASFLLILALPGLLRFGFRHGTGSMTAGILWETVSMLEYLQDDPAYHGMLDYLAGEGSTEGAVAANTRDSVHGFSNHIPYTVTSQGDNAARIRADYLRLIREQPGVWLRVKLEFAGRALDITQPLNNVEYDLDRDGRLAEFGYRYTLRREQFYGSYMGFVNGFSLLRRPWLVFAAALAALLAARKALGKKNFYNLLVLFACAAFYYGAFLVNTQSQEFRYFFLPLVLLYLCIAGGLGALLAPVWRRLGHALGRKGQEGKAAPLPGPGAMELEGAPKPETWEERGEGQP